jgi:hypothetical protein
MNEDTQIGRVGLRAAPARPGGGQRTTRQASAARLRLGSIEARDVRSDAAGTGPATPPAGRGQPAGDRARPPRLESFMNNSG